jgi:hypothetical protein
LSLSSNGWLPLATLALGTVFGNKKSFAGLFVKGPWMIFFFFQYYGKVLADAEILSSVIALMLWIRLTKPLLQILMPYSRYLRITLVACRGRLLASGVVLALLMVAIAFCLTAGFGSGIRAVSSFTSALVFAHLALIRCVDFSPLVAHSPVYGGIVAFVFLVIRLLTISLIFAVVSSSLAKVIMADIFLIFPRPLFYFLLKMNLVKVFGQRGLNS